MDKRLIVCFGPGPKFKGGISNYNTALAKTLDKIPTVDVHIVSWIQQYPAIIPREFVDKTSSSDMMEDTNVKIDYLTNYNKPGTWKETAEFIINLNPEKAIFQWAIALQGLPLGRIIKRIKKKAPHIELIMDVHVLTQKENSSIDKYFTKKGLIGVDTFIVHALKTYRELQETFPKMELNLTKTGERTTEESVKNALHLYHPIYDLYQPDASFDVAKFKKDNNLKEFIFLYFGFIRKYKGLHNAIKAFKEVSDQRDDVSFLICGESFWNTLDKNKWSTRIKSAIFKVAKSIFLKKDDDEKNYDPIALVETLGLQEKTAVFNDFIPNEDVHKYFQVADCVVLYYLTATPSGIESLSYNFNLPILATNVGHFPETIREDKNGYLAEAEDIKSMAKQMNRMIDNPIPGENVKEFAKNLSWENYVDVILKK